MAAPDRSGAVPAAPIGRESAEHTRPTARRRYRLTPAGMASLRAAARRVRPWEHSTGPRTTAGKARSRMNALRHGDRSAEMMTLNREITQIAAWVRALRAGA